MPTERVSFGSFSRKTVLCFNSTHTFSQPKSIHRATCSRWAARQVRRLAASHQTPRRRRLSRADCRVLRSLPPVATLAAAAAHLATPRFPGAPNTSLFLSRPRRARRHAPRRRARRRSARCERARNADHHAIRLRPDLRTHPLHSLHASAHNIPRTLSRMCPPFSLQRAGVGAR